MKAKKPITENSRKVFHALFIVLSLTWGLPLNAIGFLAALVMRVSGHRSRKFGWCRYFESGKSLWGGCECGIFFIRDRGDDMGLCEHEFGHAIQNCIYGPLMLFLVSIPSAIRYWYRRVAIKKGRLPETGYYDIWFENQASKLGRRFAEIAGLSQIK